MEGPKCPCPSKMPILYIQEHCMKKKKKNVTQPSSTSLLCTNRGE